MNFAGFKILLQVKNMNFVKMDLDGKRIKLMKADSLRGLRTFEGFNEALSIHDELLNKEPEDSAVLASKAHLLLSMGQFEEANNYAGFALNCDPKNPELLAFQANVLEEIGQPVLAEQYRSRANKAWR